MNLQQGSWCGESSILINSRLVEGVKVGENCVLSHCYIDTPVTISDNSVINGVWTIGLNVSILAKYANESVEILCPNTGIALVGHYMCQNLHY